ncbi:GNAT family N-acetyltransferase [Streptomyces atriruber]|uniref:GNAT family N-acetyltransferase n=1 Tax=Streptomyces atriruber TaxID=545121 RepID=UPI0006E20825|nr:GNAT family N-acetyltransferase [Streptomyces atriruber]
MIELKPRELPALAPWFPTGTPGPAAIGEHALRTGNGRWWADRARPRALAVSCADRVLLRGTPDGMTPDDLAPLAHSSIDAPARFLPLLGAAFTSLTPWERMVWTLQSPPTPSVLPRGMRVRRIEPADTDALRALGPEGAWITASWGGPPGLAASGHGWIATDRTGTALAIACAYFRGSHHEEVAFLTRPDHRRHQPALACVTALCADITARGHTPSWTCSTLDRADRLLAWTAGFRLVREYVHYAVGSPARQELLTA